MFMLPIKFREVLAQKLDAVSSDGHFCPLDGMSSLESILGSFSSSVFWVLSILQGNNIHPQVHSPWESLCEEAIEGEGAVKVRFVLEPVTCPPESTCNFCSSSTPKDKFGKHGLRQTVVKGRPKATQMLVVCSLELVVTLLHRVHCSKLGEKQHKTSLCHLNLVQSSSTSVGHGFLAGMWIIALKIKLHVHMWSCERWILMNFSW